MGRGLFIHSPAEGHLGCSQVPAILRAAGHSLTLPPGALGSSGCRQLPTALWPLDEGTASAEQRPLQSRASGKARPGLHRTLPAASLTEPVCPAGLSPAFPQQPPGGHREPVTLLQEAPGAPARPGPAGDPEGAEQCGGEGESGVSEHGSDRSPEPTQPGESPFRPGARELNTWREMTENGDETVFKSRPTGNRSWSQHRGKLRLWPALRPGHNIPSSG